MVAEGEVRKPIDPVSASDLADAKWYLGQIAEIMQEVRAGECKPADANRRLTFLKDTYHAVTNEDIADAAVRVRSPIDRLSNLRLIEHNEDQLAELELAVEEVEGLDPKKKARWLDHIARTRALQEKAKSKAIFNWIYIGRTSEDNQIFHMGAIQVRFFDVWDSAEQHSLIMAPPSHAKTMSLTGQMLWDIKENPMVRTLLWFDTEDKASKQLQLVKRYIKSKRFRALYPNLRMRSDRGNEDSAKRFTIMRENIGSREPTMEAAGTISQINGDGYDIIYVDDPCPETVAFQETTRNAINHKFDTVVSMRFRKTSLSRFRMICTPWHVKDLAGHIMAGVRNGERKNWLVAVDQFAVKKDDQGRHISLWPERYDSDYYLEREKSLYANDYSRLFELKFGAESTKIVQSVKFYPFDPEDPLLAEYPEKHQEWFSRRIAVIASAEQWLSIDPSATSGRNSAETAATQFSLTSDDRAYVRDAWFMPGNPVEMQEWIVDRIVNHNIHYILLDDQGVQTGRNALWSDYIRRRLRELNVHWTGSIIGCKSHGVNGGQNISKARRLKQVAALIQNGYLRFPGKVMRNWHAGGKLYFGSIDSPNIRKLIRQTVDFPLGTNDGVDTITQFLIHNASRLRTNLQEPSVVVETDEPYNSFRAGKKRALKEQFNRRPPNELERESQWLSTCLG